jgi:outer membrane protein OmpA-like peptidoglycan-associated protein
MNAVPTAIFSAFVRRESPARIAAALAAAVLAVGPGAGFAQPTARQPDIAVGRGAAVERGPATAAQPNAGARRAFVACPIVRDTKTVPCWLAEYAGEVYYLGIQTDISADFDPPYLGHRVLVEGFVKDGPRICGGLVLEPVNASPLPELDATCNTILPAEDRYQVPFAPRPPGPSGGRLAFDPPPGGARPASVREGPQEFVLEYDFDAAVMGRHSNALTQIFDYAREVGARRIAIAGHRGASLLSDGSTLTERADLAEIRAREVAKLLAGAGLDAASFEVAWSSELVAPDGDRDWRSRRTVVRVEP